MPAWWTVDERSPEVHRGEQERDAGDVPHQLAEAGAAYANVGDREARSRRQKEGDAKPEDEKAEDDDEAKASGDDDEAKASGDEDEAKASGDDESGDEVDEPGEGEGEGDEAGEGEQSGDDPEAEGGAD